MTNHDISQLQPGAETDVLVAEAMGWKEISIDEPYRFHQDEGGVIVGGIARRFGIWGGIPQKWSPSTDIAAAWTLFESLNDRAFIWCRERKCWRVGLADPSYDPKIEMAIVKAFLLAKLKR